MSSAAVDSLRRDPMMRQQDQHRENAPWPTIQTS
jgi:hypothetical protein